MDHEFPKHRLNEAPDIKRADGTLWYSSYKSASSAIASLFSKAAPSFYFVEAAPNPRRTWWRRWEPRFVLTGRAWEGHDMRKNGFEVVKRG